MAADEAGLVEMAEVFLDLAAAQGGEGGLAGGGVLAIAAKQQDERFAYGGVVPLAGEAHLGLGQVALLLLATVGHGLEEGLEALDLVLHQPLAVACDEGVEVALKLVLGEVAGVAEEGEEGAVLHKKVSHELGVGARLGRPRE